MEEESWKRIYGRGIMKEVSGRHLRGIWESFRRHLRGIWHLGVIWEASGKHLGGIWEASGRHLGVRSGLRRPMGMLVAKRFRTI